MEPLYVNPEALGTLAHPYYAAGENYEHIGEAYDEILPKFQDGIGRDKTGEAFYEQFIQGAKELGLRVRNLQEAMNYCGEGLTQTSELYSQAEDDAEQSTHALNADIDETLAPPAPKKAQPLQPTRASMLVAKTEVVRVNEKGERVNEKGELMEAPLRRTAVRSIHPGDPEWDESRRNTPPGELREAEPAVHKRQAFRSIHPGDPEWDESRRNTPPEEPLMRGALKSVRPGEMEHNQVFTDSVPGIPKVMPADEELLPLQPAFAMMPATVVVGIPGEMLEQQPGLALSPAPVEMVPDANGQMVPAQGRALPLAQHGETAPLPGLGGPLLVTPPPDAVPGTPFMTVVVAESGPVTREDGVVVAEAGPTEVQVVLGVTPPS
jgi:hypothetical protein